MPLGVLAPRAVRHVAPFAARGGSPVQVGAATALPLRGLRPGVASTAASSKCATAAASIVACYTLLQVSWSDRRRSARQRFAELGKPTAPRRAQPECSVRSPRGEAACGEGEDQCAHERRVAEAVAVELAHLPHPVAHRLRVHVQLSGDVVATALVEQP